MRELGGRGRGGGDEIKIVLSWHLSSRRINEKGTKM